MSLERLLLQMKDPAWDEETYNLGPALRLTEADRATYVAKLIEAAQQGDVIAIMTLAKLPAMEAVPALLSLGKSQDFGAATARRALVILGHGAEVVSEIAHDAVHGPPSTIRLVALQDLPKIGGATAIDALEQALADGDCGFRMLAWDGLVALLGLLPHIRSSEGVREQSTEVELFHSFLACDLPAFVRMGVDGMRELTTRLRAGATPESLGIAWIPEPEVFEDMREALFDPDLAFPVGEIARLTGVMRRKAEMIIAFRLEKEDLRAPAALVQLGATWTIPVLEEVAASPKISSELSDHLRKSLAALQGPSRT